MGLGFDFLLFFSYLFVFFVFLPPFLSLFLSFGVFSSSYFIFSCSFILFLNFFFSFWLFSFTFLLFSWYFFLQRYRPISEGRPISHLGSLSNSSLLYNLISVAIGILFFTDVCSWKLLFEQTNSFVQYFLQNFLFLKELLSFLFSLFLNALFILYFFKTASFISLYKSALFIFLLFSLFCPIFAFDLIFFLERVEEKITSWRRCALFSSVSSSSGEKSQEHSGTCRRRILKELKKKNKNKTVTQNPVWFDF